MIKVLLIVILILILTCIILALVINEQVQKNKRFEMQIENYKCSYFELNNRFEKLTEELQIERDIKAELAKKLADISCMSINDVLAELQHD